MMRWGVVAAQAALAVLAACGGNSDPAIVVEIAQRPSVHGVAHVEITVSNEGASQTAGFDTDGEELPLTFSITAQGRTGPIVIDIVASDEAGVPVARGSGVADAAAEDAQVMLEPSDFVVNTEFPGGQFLNQDAETNGFQLTAAGGIITVGWRDDCPVSACNQFGRRFGADALPLSTELGAGTSQFRWNQIDGQGVAHVGLATQDDGTTVALWDTPTGVSCRAMPPNGGPATNEEVIATDASVDVVSAVPLLTGYFAATWTAQVGTERVIRVAVLTPSCGVMIPAYTAGLPISFAHRPTIATTPRGTLLAWIDGGEARFRVGTSMGVFPSPATTGATLISVPTPDAVDFVRVVGIEDGFIALYRRSVDIDDQIVLHRTDDTGTGQGTDTVLAMFPADYGSPALVVRPSDGAIAATWEQCDDEDGSGCAVFARLVRQSGVPVGDAFLVNTTTRGAQTDPSVAALDDGFVIAFSDTSGDAPDIDESSVRARYIYPPFSAARGVIGATCAATPECGAGLVCAPDAAGDRVCHAACDPAAAPPLCPGGGSCTSVGPESYCVMGGG